MQIGARGVQHAGVNHASGRDWGAVYLAESDALWRALVLQTGSREIASDAVAEAFAQAIARGDEIRKPGAWIWKAAFTIARTEARQRRVGTPIALPSDPPMSDTVVDLIRALATLSSNQRAATLLHYFAGYSLAETATILGSSRSTVGVHLFRARNKLRDELGADYAH